MSESQVKYAEWMKLYWGLDEIKSASCLDFICMKELMAEFRGESECFHWNPSWDIYMYMYQSLFYLGCKERDVTAFTVHFAVAAPRGKDMCRYEVFASAVLDHADPRPMCQLGPTWAQDHVNRASRWGMELHRAHQSAPPNASMIPCDVFIQ